MERPFPHVRYFILFICINFVNYLDRGIIPGASAELNEFIIDSLHTKQPDVFLGILQSSFIVGFSIASLVFANLAKFSPPLKLVTRGMLIWCLAIFGCSMCGGSAGKMSYLALVFFRMLSGVGEASFCCIVPPLIQERGGSRAGAWIAAFYTAIPVGTALGFAYASVVAGSPLGWQMAYLLEALLMLPLVAVLGAAARRYARALPAPVGGPGRAYALLGEDGEPAAGPGLALALGEGGEEDEGSSLYSADCGGGGSGLGRGRGRGGSTLLADVRAVLSRPTFTLTVLGYSCYTAVTVGLSTFGAAFLVDLGFFSTETEASVTFGGVVSLAGLVGTPVGGLLLDAYKVDGPARLHLGCLQNLLLAASAAALLAPTALVADVRVYAALLGLACCVLFAVTAGFNVAVMLSVPPELRALALALNTLGIHALGDVPSPVVVGALKDAWAPGCVHGAATPACRADRPAIRMVELATLSYLWVAVAFLAAAWAAERRRGRRVAADGGGGAAAAAAGASERKPGDLVGRPAKAV